MMYTVHMNLLYSGFILREKIVANFVDLLLCAKIFFANTVSPIRTKAAKGSQAMPVLSIVEAQLSLHKRNIAKQPQKHGDAKKLAAHNYTAEVKNCTGVTVPIGDPVDSQHQLECSTTYMVM